MAEIPRRPIPPHLLAALLLALPALARAQTPADSGAQVPPPEQAQPAPPPAPPPAAAPAPSPPQKRGGRLYSWGSVGTTFAYGQTYGSANLGVGWLMPTGLAPNVEVGYAFGNTPTLWVLRPGLTWYMPLPFVRPYLGAYYTHWFVGSGQADQDGVGGRAGFALGRVISLGVTYDHLLGCSQYCDSWAPQISAGLSL